MSVTTSQWQTLTDAIFFLQKHHKGLHRVTGPRKGPDPAKEALKRFVRRCARLYKDQTGKRPTVSGSMRTEFQRFIDAMAWRAGVPIQSTDMSIREVLRELKDIGWG